MSKILVFLLTFSIFMTSALSQQALNCFAAYNQYIGASNFLQGSANVVYNTQARMEQQRQNNEFQLIRFEQTRQQIEQARQAALSFNQGNTGGCVVNSFLFGGRFGNCVPAAVNNGINIRIGFDNQLRFLAINRANFERFAATQMQRMAQVVANQINFFNTQKDRCRQAFSRAQSCVNPFPNRPAPEFPANATCEIDIAPLNI